MLAILQGCFYEALEQLWSDALPDITNDLLDLNPGPVGYKPSAFTIKPRSFFFIKASNCEISCSLIINFDLLVSPAPFKDIRINEVNVDTVGFKDKGEYIELIG